MNAFENTIYGRWSRAENSENGRPSAEGADDERNFSGDDRGNFPRNRYAEEYFGSQTRISDVRENWRLRIAKENAEKESRSREKPRKPKKKEQDFPPTNFEDFSEAPTAVGTEWKYSESESDTPENAEEDRISECENAKKKGFVVEPDRDVYNEQQEADSLNEPASFPEPVSSPEPLGERKNRPHKFRSGKSFFGQFLTSRTGTPTPTAEMIDYKEPFSQLWVTLSTLYGQLLVVLMLAFCLTEVMDNSVKLLSLQGVFLVYLYVGSIAVIICIYIWVLIDGCASLQGDSRRGLPPTITTSIIPDGDDFRSVSATKFGSLKKAHISRDRTSNTSFYLRVGAIAFGLGTLVFNGLEMAMHSMMEGSCLDDVVFVHPVLHGLFTFLQMHFLFVNSQVLVERFGSMARFGFMHLAATNLALWVKLVVWESGNEWTYFVHLAQNVKPGTGHTSTDVPTPLQLRGFPKFVVRQERDVSFYRADDSVAYRPISDEHISQVVSLHRCLNANTLGQLWTSSMPFLYPFIIQFSLIAAAVTFVMGQNVAKDRLFFQKKKVGPSESKSCSLPTMHEGGSWGVDCGGASKGLFLGLLCLVAGTVVIIIFLVVKEDESFPVDTLFWLTTGTLMTILGITAFVNFIGLVQIRKLSTIGRSLSSLDKILSTISLTGVQLYSVFGIVVGAVGIATDESVVPEGAFLSRDQKRHVMLLSIGAVQLLQSTMQTAFIGEAIGRTSITRNQIISKPARQTVTYLMFGNAVLWAFDTFVVQSWMSQELQLRFYGVLVWGVVSRIGLPLLVFFRFHSCVLLLEIWKKSYQSLHSDPGN